MSRGRPACAIAYCRRLTLASLRSPSLSSPAAERGEEKQICHAERLKHLLCAKHVEEDPSLPLRMTKIRSALFLPQAKRGASSEAQTG